MKLTDKQSRILTSYQCSDLENLLRIYPIRYQVFEEVPYESWQKDTIVFFEGKLLSAIKRSFIGGKRTVERFEVLYHQEVIKVTTFNRRYLNAGMFNQRIVIQGKVSGDNQVVATTINSIPLTEQLGLKAVYPLHAGIKQYEIGNLIKKALKTENKSPDFISESYRQAYQLLHHQQAVYEAHLPTNQEMLRNALRTLKYEEFLAYQCRMVLEKLSTEALRKDPKEFETSEIKQMIDNLPYQLTKDQMTSIQEILKDLKSDKPMNRLLQGDVGSGKTIVVFLAMYACALSGQQAALLAPTEILCEQHYEGALKLFEPFGIKVVRVTQSTKKEAGLLDSLSLGKAQIIVGTHALFQSDVSFHNLGLIVTDEQHRFGVRQRTTFEQMGDRVDRLMLSATPIPRTLANVLYQQLDISTIQTYPAHHKPIITRYVKENSIRSILPDLEESLQRGEQIFMVSASIEESESMQLKSVTQLEASLKKVFKEYSVAKIHGQMKNDQKNAIMQDFLQNNIQILVATTVIEVGIDVKNATIIVIYHAERFGLSTLHQLRGRVGRGEKQGYCYVLSDADEETTVSRLQKFESNQDGFALANEDLKTRGPGDMLGLRQSGLPLFALGDFFADQNIMVQAAKDAQKIISTMSLIDRQRLAKKLEEIHTVNSQ